MKNLSEILILFLISSCVPTLSLSAENHDDKKEYIVYMGSTYSSKYFTTSQHHVRVLQQVTNNRSAKESITQSYHKSFSGFAARLTKKEYEQLKGMKEVVSIFPSKKFQVHTTRSWDFLGLPLPTSEQKVAASNVIVGVIDTGIWPESPSFRDDGLGPIPKKWKGVCQGGQNFTCNKKLIGRRSYVLSTSDEEGHGTHTASTAAGSIVNNAHFYGIGKGSARGAVPTARIASYKVCDMNGCNMANILKAFDDAISDGVDVITVSIGGNATIFNEDPIAVGAFHAMQKGILTTQSAGNDGDASGTVASVAPWVFTTAASTTDRRFIDKVVLGNGKTLIGNSVNGFTMKKKFPILYGKGVSGHCEESQSRICYDGCLDELLVKGKIVVCDNKNPYSSALDSHAAGVLAQTAFENVSYVIPLPASALSMDDLTTIESYINTTKYGAPFAKILKSEAINDTNAPVVAGFSSRGPNTIASDILKPDIAAPGVSILAAFSPIASPSQFPQDKRSVAYNVLSGTSMACPHLAGAVAYLKSLHPDWSPAALKSALMTTATPMGPEKNAAEEFSYGSGHLNPVKAANPGLVYEANHDDYIQFLCKLDYETLQVRRISGNDTVSCPKKSIESNDYTPKDVNYPSLSAMVDPNNEFRVSFSRTVTNVGVANSTYAAKVVSSSPTLKVIVKPTTLCFKRLKEHKSFEVTVLGSGLKEEMLVTGSLVWSDGIHSIRSPIVVYTST